MSDHLIYGRQTHAPSIQSNRCEAVHPERPDMKCVLDEAHQWHKALVPGDVEFWIEWQ